MRKQLTGRHLRRRRRAKAGVRAHPAARNGRPRGASSEAASALPGLRTRACVRVCMRGRWGGGGLLGRLQGGAGFPRRHCDRVLEVVQASSLRAARARGWRAPEFEWKRLGPRSVAGCGEGKWAAPKGGGGARAVGRRVASELRRAKTNYELENSPNRGSVLESRGRRVI